MITIGYVPDVEQPVLLSYDCRIDQQLGIRQDVAAEDPDLLGVLWTEHDDRVANGARERKRARISPKLRTGLKSIRKNLDVKNVEGAKKALQSLQSLVDKMATKGMIHKNTASRYKSRLAAKIAK